MITQYQVHSLLAETLPQLPLETYPSSVSLEIYVSINCLTNYTRHVFQKGNYNELKKCFLIAENLYLNGNGMVHLLMDDIFIDSFASFMSPVGAEMLMIKSILPDTLYKAYRKHSLKLIANNYKNKLS